MKTLYMNGKILTMEDQEERTQDARAVLVCDGRVQAVGDDETLRAMAGGHARIVNLANRTPVSYTHLTLPTTSLV